MLHRGGYHVVSAEGPRRALEIVKNDPPVRLVLSDIVMPEMRGPQLIRDVVRLSPDTPAVLMTGGIVNAADMPSGVSVLRKPFAIWNLFSAFEATLSESAESRAKLQNEQASLAMVLLESERIYAEAAEAGKTARKLCRPKQTPHGCSGDAIVLRLVPIDEHYVDLRRGGSRSDLDPRVLPVILRRKGFEKGHEQVVAFPPGDALRPLPQR
jgi:CheY-like chemotaxis protein